MAPELARKILMSARTAVGWSSLLAPRLILRVFGVQGPIRAELVYAMRLFGIRDVLLAYQLYQAQRHDAGPDELEEALRQGIAVDTIDTASALVGGAFGKLRGSTALMGAGFAALAAALGYLGREAPDAQGAIA